MHIQIALTRFQNNRVLNFPHTNLTFHLSPFTFIVFHCCLPSLLLQQGEVLQACQIHDILACQQAVTQEIQTVSYYINRAIMTNIRLLLNILEGYHWWEAIFPSLEWSPQEPARKSAHSPSMPIVPSLTNILQEEVSLSHL